MNLHTLRTISELARDILRQYSDHPDSVNIIWHNRADLLCMCAIASVFLSGRLHQAGIQDARVVRGKFRCDNSYLMGHVWVEIPSQGLIIDLAAGQFQNYIAAIIPDVLITDTASHLGQRFVKGKATPLVVRHIFSFWPSDMHPWGRINGVNHQDWLLRAWANIVELEAAA